MGKIAVIGVGKVGAALAFLLAADPFCDELVLVDLDQDKARAEAADLQHALGLSGARLRVRDGSYYDCADADVCVLTVCAHFPPAAAQLERIDRAATVVGRIVPSVMATGFDGIFLVVTDPVDLMTWLVHQLSDLPDARVLGIGTALDTARLRSALAGLLSVPPGDIDAWVLGRHGVEPVIPWSRIAVSGRPLDQFLREAGDRAPHLDRDALCNTVAEVSYQLAAVKGAPVFGIAAAAAAILRQLLRGGARPVPVSAMLHGEYGQRDVYLGVPALLGPGGVQRILELPLDRREQTQLDHAVRALRQYMTDIA